MSWSSGPLKRLMVPLRRSGVMWNLSPPLSDTSILPALKLSKGCLLREGRQGGELVILDPLSNSIDVSRCGDDVRS